MKSSEVTATIVEICANPDSSFPDKTEEREQEVNKCDFREILEHLDYAGVIPERFSHDSTEEKLFAKYCDALLARALCELEINATIIQERADAADVSGEGNGYSIVGDAKAFRMSRTAKNQKDFKVGALNTWRKGATYAVLVAPLYQYPKDKSQIYSQAVHYQVALLSYTHFAFLLRNKPTKGTSLKPLWEVPKKLRRGRSGKEYWRAVLGTILKITGRQEKQWREAVSALTGRLQKQAKEQIEFLEREKTRLQGLSHAVAVKELIRALRIDAKIREVEKTARTVL